MRPAAYSTYLQDPSIAGDDQGAVNATIGIITFTSTRERVASGLKMSEALLVLGVDHAGTPDGTATCQRR